MTDAEKRKKKLERREKRMLKASRDRLKSLAKRKKKMKEAREKQEQLLAANKASGPKVFKVKDLPANAKDPFTSFDMIKTAKEMKKREAAKAAALGRRMDMKLAAKRAAQSASNKYDESPPPSETQPGESAEKGI